jgi:hypothetical protein
MIARGTDAQFHEDHARLKLGEVTIAFPTDMVVFPKGNIGRAIFCATPSRRVAWSAPTMCTAHHIGVLAEDIAKERKPIALCCRAGGIRQR